MIAPMMDALHHMPNLRILELHHSIPSHTTSNGHERRLEFKFLEQLRLNVKAVDCAFFLRHIQYPSCVKVTLECSAAGIEDCTTILSLVGRYSHRTHTSEVTRSPAIIRSAWLTCPHTKVAEVAFFDKVESMRYDCSPDGFEPIVQIQFDGGYALLREHHRLLPDVCNFFDLSRLEKLYTSWNLLSYQIPSIQDSLGKLPKLNLIRMSKSSSDICLAIAGSAEESLVDKPEETNTHHYSLCKRASWHIVPPVNIFPALRTVVIEGADFRRDGHPKVEELLVDMLMKRSNINAPIDNLFLEECSGVCISRQKQLAELVVRLMVDGDEVNAQDL